MTAEVSEVAEAQKQPGTKRSNVFVGFGFGAIQAGLFLYEAQQAGAFDRLVVAEVVPEVVGSIRKAGGHFRVNVARSDRIEVVDVGPIEIFDPADDADRHALVSAIGQAQEIATAVPSVNFYKSAAPGSIHRLLAAGLQAKASDDGPRAIIYAAENHNHAAEILRERVLEEIPREAWDPVTRQVRFLNTVIGKMSGVITDPHEIKRASLATVTEGDRRAFLVEEFNRILISKIDFGTPGSSFSRGVSVFNEKEDLLPFEEAKLYGHNATHALGAYLAQLRNIPRIADLRHVPVLMGFLRDAFLEESGAALVRKHRGVDPLFTPEGYQAYADDLLVRMTNPYLSDTTERVGRDPRRKLGWDDRLVGTVRVALGQGIRPWRYSIGVAAGLACLHPGLLNEASPCLAPLLDELWGPVATAPEKQAVEAQVDRAWGSLRQWLRTTGVVTAPSDPAA